MPTTDFLRSIYPQLSRETTTVGANCYKEFQLFLLTHDTIIFLDFLRAAFVINLTKSRTQISLRLWPREVWVGD